MMQTEVKKKKTKKKTGKEEMSVSGNSKEHSVNSA